MAATSAQTLFSEVSCYACAGASEVQLLRLAMMRRTLLALLPSADVSFQGLMAYSKCYACYGASVPQLLEMALLDQISQNL